VIKITTPRYLKLGTTGINRPLKDTWIGEISFRLREPSAPWCAHQNYRQFLWPWSKSEITTLDGEVVQGDTEFATRVQPSDF
jgi:hypothetical protein